MTEEIGWHHPTDESDQWDGFNDSGIEHFRGNPIAHLAREINQNALDASDAGIAEVHFYLQDVESATIPHVEELKKNLTCCLEAAASESTKAETFFKNAINEINNKKIAVLEISDYNTRGMKGPSRNGTPFYAFMKAKGQSRKDSDTASGSYGIGKFAPYAVSNVRTIILSTVYENGNPDHWVQLTQGKSILMSHEKDGERKQGVGFWGIRNKCQPVVGVTTGLPNWILRATKEEDLPSSVGSKISVLCFNASENWEKFLAVSVAENYFGAISDGKLRVDIGKKHILDQSTIAEFLNDDEIKKCIEPLQNEPEQFENSGYYLAALQNTTEVIVEESEMLHLGLCQLRILIGEGLPKKVCALRNGMLISDNLNKLKRFSDFKEFVAVVQCKSTKGNELLRAMEPPRHDNFEPDRLSTKEEQKRGKKALSDLELWIREQLKRHAKDPVSEVTPLEELKDYFGEEGSDGSGEGTEEMNPEGAIKIRARPIKTKASTPSYVNDGDDRGKSEGELGEGGGGGAGEGGGDGAGGKGGSSGGTGGGSPKPMVDLHNVRTILRAENQRMVAFTPTFTGRIALRIYEAGADVDYMIEIVESNAGIIENGCLILDVATGNRSSLEIKLNDAFQGAIKVVANEI